MSQTEIVTVLNDTLPEPVIVRMSADDLWMLRRKNDKHKLGLNINQHPDPEEVTAAWVLENLGFEDYVERADDDGSDELYEREKDA